jgi:hypothetical protein
MSTISKSAIHKITRAIRRGFRPGTGIGVGDFLRAKGKPTSRAQRNRRFRTVKFGGAS